MQTGDYIALGVIAVTVIAAIIYLIRQKKKGVKCIGCPYAKGCGKSDCNCSGSDELK